MVVPEQICIHRYTSFRFPAFIYIPKQTTKPNVDHIPNFNESGIAFSSQTWKESKTFLYAIDLFNYRYYWEVHEVFEKLWFITGKKSPEGIFIQGLIQLSVALLKKAQSNPVGVFRLAEKAIPKILSQKGIYLGIEVEKLVDEFKSLTEEIRTAPPSILLKFDFSS
jgi:hypothetical protein